MEEKQKYWLDIDCGVDDFSSVLFLLGLERFVEIVGISIVEGNIPIMNSKVSLDSFLSKFSKKKIPFFVGAGEPILPTKMKLPSWEGHGEHGFGDWEDFERVSEEEKSSFSPKNAILALLDFSTQQKDNSFNLLALGPLTNVALALKLDPSVALKIKSFYWMGGTSHSKGNSSISAEYNAHIDPEACAIVLEKLAGKVNVIPWETTVIGRTKIEWFQENLFNHQNEKCQFLKRILCKYSSFEYAKVVGMNICDLLATVVAVFPAVVTESHKLTAFCELGGVHSRGLKKYNYSPIFSKKTFPENVLHKNIQGSLFFDWYSKKGEKPNVNLITNVDADKFREILVQNFTE